jgi:hypothetical protein
MHAGRLQNRHDESQAILDSARRAVDDLTVMARSARSLVERQIDLPVTCDTFESLCKRDVPIHLVSALVWPAVAALAQQASLLQVGWTPTLARADWEPRHRAPVAATATRCDDPGSTMNGFTTAASSNTQRLCNNGAYGCQAYASNGDVTRGAPRLEVGDDRSKQIEC